MKKKTVSVGIAPDDLKIGDFVAVIEPKQQCKPLIVMGRDSDGDPMMMHMSKEPSQKEGVPHKVLGISWPWIVFGVLMPGGNVDGPIIHDLRKIKCMKLDSSFVEAIKAFERPESDKPTEQEMPF